MGRYKLSIRTKLLLLAGIPLLGALALAVMIARDAVQQARRAASLGSMESLAELSQRIGALVDGIEAERALLALTMGTRARAAEEGTPVAAASTPELDARAAATERARVDLEEFLRRRSSGALPARLAEPLRAGLDQARALGDVRTRALEPGTSLVRVLEAYGRPAEELVRASAGLNELTDDGDVLRTVTCLVASLELKERASREHADLAFAFAAGDFAPGTYRELVSLLTEEEAFATGLQTYATPELREIYARETGSEAALFELRKVALQSSSGSLEGDPKRWFAVGDARVASLRRVESGFHDQLRALARAKLDRLQRSVLASGVFVGVVLFAALAFAWAVARQISGRVQALRVAADKIAVGELSTRVAVAADDELGALGGAFNHMAGELENARMALQEKARMARELEIAATVQRLLLPARPSHPAFAISGRMQPADEVGGDFYDVLVDEQDSSLWLTIGDVSSHGLVPGLVMLMTQAAISAQFRARRDATPADVLRAVNATLCENIVERMHDNKYVTAQLLMHERDGLFRCAGAHLMPIVYRAATRSCEIVDAVGPWLGILPSLPSVPVTEIALAAGDVLCLYSDGLIEARDPAGAMFDLAGLVKSVESHLSNGADLDAAVSGIFADVAAFAAEQDDDRTLLLVQRR